MLVREKRAARLEADVVTLERRPVDLDVGFVRVKATTVARGRVRDDAIHQNQLRALINVQRTSTAPFAALVNVSAKTIRRGAVGQHQVLEPQLPVDTKMRGQAGREESGAVCGRDFHVIVGGDDKLLVDHHVVRNLDVRAICDGFPERRWRRHRYRRVRGGQRKQPYEESTHRFRYLVRCRNFCAGSAEHVPLIGSLMYHIHMLLPNVAYKTASTQACVIACAGKWCYTHTTTGRFKFTSVWPLATVLRGYGEVASHGIIVTDRRAVVYL